MTAKDLRAKRAAAGIPGHAVCKLAGIARSRLSDVEREHVSATAEELQRIEAAVDEIIRTREDLVKLATEAGLSLEGVHL